MHTQKLRMERKDFQQLVSELKGRGFVAKELREMMVIVDHQTEGSFSRKIGDCELTIGGDVSNELLVLRAKQGIGGLMPVDVWASINISANRNLTFLTSVFKNKNHYISGTDYSASLIPSSDAGIVIKNAITLNDAVGSISRDAEISNGLDAKEAYDRLCTAINGLKDENQYKADIKNRNEQYLKWLGGKYEYELGRIRADRKINEAMDLIADR